MIPKEFDTVTKSDIVALVTNAVSERRTIECKQQLPGNGDEEKQEFLADVSSFANAAGGDIIYGITEERDENGKATGIPEKAEGLANINTGAEKLRLEEIIRTGIDPRIPGLRIEHYDGFPAGPTILIRIPKSWVMRGRFPGVSPRAITLLPCRAGGVSEEEAGTRGRG